jgi:hypothetical protein
VGILGPRQCGKTTLARQFESVYFDLEDAGSRTRLDVEWDALMKGGKLLVLDEAHQAPEVFPRLRGAIDAERELENENLLVTNLPGWLARLGGS